jgi:hypothetical protein
MHPEKRHESLVSLKNETGLKSLIPVGFRRKGENMRRRFYGPGK